MISNRIILFFLGVIILIVIVLSSQKLSAALRNRLSGVFPKVQTVKVGSDDTLTPTPSIKGVLSPTPVLYTNTKTTTQKPVTTTKRVVANTPNTGPESVPLLLLAGMGMGGALLTRLTKKNG